MSRRWFEALAVVVVLLLSIGSAYAQSSTFDRSDPWREMSWRGQSDGDDDDDDDTNGFGFGKRIAGTWLGMGSFDLDALGPDPVCDGIVSIPIGVPVLDTHMFGAGGSYSVVSPNNPNSIQGTWVKTGPRQITSEAIGFGSDPNCTDNEDDGVCEGFGPLVSIFSIKTVVDFDPGYRTATTTFAATVHPPTEDPFDPDATVNVCTIGAHTSFRKVTVPLN